MRLHKSILALLVLALAAWAAVAEVGGNNSISVTNTATTATLSRPAKTVCFISDSASTHKYFARLFTDGETAAAATTSSPIYVVPGGSVCIDHDSQTQSGSGWGGYSVITAPAETATARILTK